MTTTGQVVARLLETALDAEPWYGLSTSRFLAGLTAKQAASHPITACHSIWEIVLHMVAWQGEVVRRLAGGTPADPVEGDWPVVGDTTDARWLAALQMLSASTRATAGALRDVSDESLSAMVGGSERNVSIGSGIDRHELIVGLLQHNAYHSGQIALIRKAGGW